MAHLEEDLASNCTVNISTVSFITQQSRTLGARSPQSQHRESAATSCVYSLSVLPGV